MKGFEFDFDEEIFGQSNSRKGRIQEAYTPKQCDPEVCWKEDVLVLNCLLVLIKSCYVMKLELMKNPGYPQPPMDGRNSNLYRSVLII